MVVMPPSPLCRLPLATSVVVCGSERYVVAIAGGSRYWIKKIIKTDDDVTIRGDYTKKIITPLTRPMRNVAHPEAAIAHPNSSP